MKTQKILLKVYQKSNFCLKNMKKNKTPVLKEKSIQEIQSVSAHPNFRLRKATSYYSFRTNKDNLSGCSNLNKGCHAFVKHLVFGEESKNTLAIVTPYEGMSFEIEEIELYVELLSKIGFDIKLEGVYKFSELTSKYSLLKQQANNYTSGSTNSSLLDYIFTGNSNTTTTVEKLNDSKFLFFTLGQNYKENHALIRYVAMCYLRYLFCSYTQWFPRMFLTYYKYFKKIKVKPSLDKILLFTYSSPILNLYNNDKDVLNKIKNSSITQENAPFIDNLFRYGYYCFNGSREANKEKRTSFSTLLAAPNDFKLINYLENYVKTVQKSVKGFIPQHVGYYTEDLGRTVFINDDNQIANVVNDLILKNEYHKAYLYLKSKTCKFVKIKGEFILKPPTEQISLQDYLKSKQTEDITLNSNDLKELLKD